MGSISLTAFRIVIALAGALIVFTGVNVAFGGIATLGLQGPTDFFAVTSADDFAAHDSHVRFLGGLWMGIGLLFLISATDPVRFKPMLGFAFALIFIGGLARLTSLRWDVVFGPSIVGSLAAELLVMPLLLLWLIRGIKRA